MKWFRRPFMTFALICLIIGLMPYWQHVTMRGLPDGRTETRNVFTLGIPPSPLLVLEQSHSAPVKSIRPDGGVTIEGGNYHSSVELGFVSWSMLALVLGALLFEADRRWGKSPETIPGN